MDKNPTTASESDDEHPSSIAAVHSEEEHLGLVGLAADDDPLAPRIIAEHVALQNVRVDLIEAEWGALRALPLEPPLTIVATGDMRASCCDRERELYRTFVQERGTSEVLAKAVISPDDSKFILLRHDLVVSDRIGQLPELLRHSRCTLERLLEHEGIHLVVRSRGEGALSTLPQCQLDGDHVREQFRMIAALGIEEFRVEYEQCLSGNFLAAPEGDASGEFVERYEQILRGSFNGKTSTERAIQALRAMSTLNEMTEEVAAIAAAHLAGRELAQTLSSDVHWRRVFGPAWQPLLDAFAAIPQALVCFPSVEREEAVAAVGEILQNWFEQLGFFVEDPPDGDGLFFSADPEKSSLNLSA